MDVGVFHVVIAIIFLMLTACVAAMVFKKIRVPYTIGLVAVGIGLSCFFSAFPHYNGYKILQLNKDLIMYALLPALIFDASVNMDVKLLRRNLVPTLVLAGPGLVIATLITGGIVCALTPLTIGYAMLFGALISATDPVAVISLFEIVGAPKRLRILVDGESLFNDATAIVMFNIVLAMVVSGTALTVSSIFGGAVDFVVVFVGGLLVGMVIGFIVTRLLVFAEDDPLLEVAMSIIAAYISFLVADRCFALSGVMATMGAGVTISYYGQTKFTPLVKTYMSQFWSFASFTANSMIFLLLGFTEELTLLSGHLSSAIWPILAAVLAIQVARAVVVYGICPFFGMGKNGEKVSWQYQTVMFWGGLRGAVPLALVFSLAPDMPFRSLIIDITLGVVLFTLLVQGTTIQAMLHFFHLDDPAVYTVFARCYARIRARQYACDQVRLLPDTLDRARIEKFLKQSESGVTEAEKDFEPVLNNMENVEGATMQLVWSRALSAERAAYEKWFNSSILSEPVYRKLTYQVGQMQESVFWYQAPAEKLLRRPLEMRLRSAFFRILARYSLFHAWTRTYQGMAVSDDFWMLIALQVGATAARNAVSELGKQPIFPGINNAAESVVAYYSKRDAEVRETLANLQQSHEKVMDAVKDSVILQVFFLCEQGAVNHLAENGVIPESVGEELSAELKERSQENYRNLAEKCNELEENLV